MRTFSTFLIGSVLVILAVKLSAAEEDRREFETAKAEYEQSSHDEAARATYVTKLAHRRPVGQRLSAWPATRRIDGCNQLGIAKASGS
jgi:hypothetical protein